MIYRPRLPYQKLKRTVHIARHKTSFSLETAFWQALKEIAAEEGVPVSTLVTRIDMDGDHRTNLSSSLRLHVLDYYVKLAKEKAK